MALVQKRNPVRNAISFGIFAVAVVGGLLFLFRDRIFPARTPEAMNVNIHVRDLPAYPATGVEVLNTNAAAGLTPHGATAVNGNAGRDNPFQPLNVNGGPTP